MFPREVKNDAGTGTAVKAETAGKVGDDNGVQGVVPETKPRRSSRTKKVK